MIEIIPGWRGFQWCEVWEITEMKEGMVFKTKTTNTFIREKDKDSLPKGFLASPLSTNLTAQDEITLTIWEK